MWIAEGLYLRRFVEVGRPHLALQLIVIRQIEEVPSIFNAKMQGLMTLEAS